jgi:hypothetical protein
VNCTAVRVRGEFDIDIQHHWCWLKWRDSLRCPLMPDVEPCECSECAYAYDHGRATQPRVKVDVRVHPPKQSSTSKREPDAGSDKLAEAQMGNRFEPRYDCEAEGEPEKQHNAYEEYRNWPHFPFPFS